MAAYTVRQLDDIEELADAGAHYQPIRVALGISAFGVTAWTGHQPGDRVINEHDEGDPTSDEELFLVLRGHALFDVDGDRIDAPIGTLVSAAPGARRSAVASAPATTILLVEGTRGAAYDARGWELWAPIAPRYFNGEYAEVADRLRAIVAEHPEYPMLFFNLACCEGFLGQTAEAIEHLRVAIELSEEFRESAKDDSDLDGIRGEPAFQRLIGGADETGGAHDRSQDSQ